MFMFNKTATLVRRYMNVVDGDGSAGGSGAQDIESRIQAALYPEKAPDGNEHVADDEGAAKDGKTLPKADHQNGEGNVGADDDDEEVEVDEDTDLDDDEEVTLANMLGIDEDKIKYDDKGNVVVTAVINGENHEVTMSELVKSFQLQGHVNNKSVQLENERKEFHATRDQAYSELTTRLKGLNQLTKFAEDQLVAEFKGIDWDALRMTEPGEWAALQQQFTQRLEQINQVKRLAGEEGNRMTQEQQKELETNRSNFLKAEYEKMVTDNPAWVDQNVMAKDFAEIGAFLRDKYGFTDEEVANNLDARLMRMIQDARAFQQGKKVADKKLPKEAPKFIKPGKTGDRPSLQKARAVKAQKDNIRKSGGSVDSIAAAIVDRM